jgi:hypothetical protein
VKRIGKRNSYPIFAAASGNDQLLSHSPRQGTEQGQTVVAVRFFACLFFMVEEKDSFKNPKHNEEHFYHPHEKTMGGCCSILFFVPTILLILLLIYYFVGQYVQH